MRDNEKVFLEEEVDTTPTQDTDEIRLVCSLCRTPLTTDDKVCPGCGAEVVFDDEAEDALEPDYPKKKKWILPTVIGGVAALILILAIVFVVPMMQYNNAVSLMASGEFQEAWGVFDALGDYRDSAEKMKLCQYNQALKLLEDGNYKSAGQLFEKLGDYEESREKIKECNYVQATDLLKEGKLTEAQEAFAALGDYKDSLAQITECKYLRASALIAKQKYAEAMVLLEELGNYKNCADMVKECNYQAVVNMVSAGQYDQALTALENLGEYKDSADLVKECNYQKALVLVTDGKYEEALTALEPLGEYKDVQTQIKECKYHLAVAILDGGNIVEGYDALIALDGYKDSADKAKAVKETYDRIKSKDKVFRNGIWWDQLSQRCYMEMDIVDKTKINIEIHWSGSSTSGSVWELTGKWDASTGKLTYTDCTSYSYQYVEEDGPDQGTKKITEKYKNGSGYFYYKNGYLYWVANNDDSVKGLYFEHS